MRPSVLSLSAVLAVIFAMTFIAIPAVTAAEYDISVDDGVSVPEQTVEIEEFDDEFDIDTFVVAESGDSVTVDVTAPEDDGWNVDLLDQDGDRVDWEGGGGAESVEIGTDNLDPGTYGLALIPDDTNQYEAVIPLVINGYSIGLSYETSVEADSELEITAEVTETEAQSEPEEVEFVAWDGDDETRETLESTGGNTYEGTVTLDEGAHGVYVATMSGDEVEGFPAVSAIKSGPSISAGEVDDDDSDDDDSDDSNSGDGGAGGGDAPPDLQSTWQTEIGTTATETGESVTITLGLRNAGGAAANETVTINGNGEPITDTDVRLTSNSVTLVELEHVFTDPGEYELTAESETLGTVALDTVTVSGDPIEDDDPSLEDTDDTPTETETAGGSENGTTDDDSIPGFGIVVGLVAIFSLLLVTIKS